MPSITELSKAKASARNTLVNAVLTSASQLPEAVAAARDEYIEAASAMQRAYEAQVRRIEGASPLGALREEPK